MDTPLHNLADADGIILRRDILATGGDDRTIARALRGGEIVRVRNGAYAVRILWESYDDATKHLVRARAAYGASNTKVAVSHVSAALMWGAPMWRPQLDDVHLTRLDGKAGRREAGVCQHRGALREGDLTSLAGICVTSPTRTALDVSTVAGLEQSVPIMDHFLHTKQTSRKALRLGAQAMTYWADSLGTDMAVSLADGRRESIGEGRTAVILRGSGRPAPEPQYKIYDKHGNVVARVDFAWPELGVFLEFDGKVKYQALLKEGEDVTQVVLREKKREELICRLTGWRCIRLVWADLARPAETRRYIVSVLDGGPVYI